MDKIEKQRYCLYKAIERGDKEEILDLSRKLDELIVLLIRSQYRIRTIKKKLWPVL